MIKKSKWVKRTGKKKDSSSLDIKNVFDLSSLEPIFTPGAVNAQTGAIPIPDPDNNQFYFIMYVNLHVPFILNPYVRA